MKLVLRIFALLLTVFAAPQLRANIVGLDLQNFNPAPTSVDGVTVSNALTLGQGRWGLGLFVNYASNTLPYFRNFEGKTRDQQKDFNDSVTTLDLQVAYGLTNFWDIYVTVPYIIGQQVRDDDELHGYFARKGQTSIRLGSKLRLLQTGPFALGLIGNANYNRVESNPYTGSSSWPVSTLELAASLNYGRLLLTANAGYRWRFGEPSPEITRILPIEEYGDQFIYSAGLVLPLHSQWALMGEVYGAANSDEFSEQSARSTTIAEGLLGLRYEPIPELQLHAGFGGELRHSVSSADARAYAGIRWTIGQKEERSETRVSPPVAVAPPLTLVAEEPDEVIDLDDVHFPFGSVEIRDPNSKEVLAKLSRVMRQHSNIEKVLIEGHTCDIGSYSFNQKLSDRRALAVESWLTNRYGIDDKKLHSIGWGEMQPKVENSSIKNRRINRRVSFKIFFRKNSNPPAVRLDARRSP